MDKDKPSTMPAEQQPPARLVRFAPFKSRAEPPFWLDHSSRKLNELRLDESGSELAGHFGAGGSSEIEMRYDASSGGQSSSGGDEGGGARAARRNERVRAGGTVHSLNTVESFKRLDKNRFLNDAALSSILDCCRPSAGEEESDPNEALVRTACVTHCDLKLNRTVYWFAYPALSPRRGRAVAYSALGRAQSRLGDVWDGGRCRRLAGAFHSFRIEQESSGSGVVWCPPYFILLTDDDGGVTRCMSLSKSNYGSLSDEERTTAMFGFVDPNSSTAGEESNELQPVGWTLRNLVAYLSLGLGLGGSDRRFLSYRSSTALRRIELDNEELGGEESHGFEDLGRDDGGIGRSLLLSITIPLAVDYQWPATTDQASSSATTHEYKCVGWELNQNNKPGPRSVDLRPLVSPAHLSRQANDLNLRLMKWRALPSLDVGMLSRLKVLLLGAGTLGCNAARTLLGWGVRNMTFVDGGRVSYSNPVRQSLFTVDDCREGGKFKATAAAEALSSIAGPDVRAEGVVLMIPMPGHPYGDAEAKGVAADIKRLHSLVDEHDVVFLLTDTRESRWLPTVACLATDTPLINSALGLDGWLVMRHGPSSTLLEKHREDTGDDNGDGGGTKQHPERLGCYFCGDVVAPDNSTRDRTLDQQCTVTRPGLAPIAAGMAAELMVAMFHHPLGQRAAASGGLSSSSTFRPAVNDAESALGLLPHQIRGTVVSYTMMTPTVPAFGQCTACSSRVVDEYRRRGAGFVGDVCRDRDGGYLERVSGLDEFRRAAGEAMDGCLDWDDDDEEED